MSPVLQKEHLSCLAFLIRQLFLIRGKNNIFLGAGPPYLPDRQLVLIKLDCVRSSTIRKVSLRKISLEKISDFNNGIIIGHVKHIIVPLLN